MVDNTYLVKKQTLPYSAVPSVFLAIVAVASLGSMVDGMTVGAICARPAALLTDVPGCASVARLTSSRLAEAARRFRGQMLLGSAADQPPGDLLTHSSFASYTGATPAPLSLVNPHLTNLPPPSA